MTILVINCGSSSLKSAVIDPQTERHLIDIRIEGIGAAQSSLHVDDASSALPACSDYAAALEHLALAVQPFIPDVTAVGHRVVHGGERFVHPTLIDADVLGAIADLVTLAPLHNAACLAGIQAARHLLPDIPHVAVFDTAFHSTLPPRAKAYALPRDISARLGLRRYGFHGISHESVSRRAARFLDSDLRELRIISCHLGNGCSMAAVEYGRSVETSMGMTPLEGLVMGSRSGDLDPGVIIQLLRELHLSADDLDQMLNRESGLLGMAGVADMRQIEERAAAGDEFARMALHVFTHRIRKYIGAYAAVMGGVDAIVFTGGIGENSALVRHRTAQRLDFLGARIDEDSNREAQVGVDCPVAEFSLPHSRTRLLVVATDEEGLIAEQSAQLLAGQHELRSDLRVPIAVSARHVHLTTATIVALFGPGHQLQVKHPLSQPGQFAAVETVTLVGPKHSIENVRVLGPPRAQDQVEISRTDEFHLGIDAPVRSSGDIDNTPGITLQGPQGTVQLTRGVICALRHIHMTPQDATQWGVRHGDMVDIAIDSKQRDLEFRDVLIRVDPNFKLEMHLDTDEANAAELGNGDQGVLAHTDSQARLTRKRL